MYIRKQANFKIIKLNSITALYVTIKIIFKLKIKEQNNKLTLTLHKIYSQSESETFPFLLFGYKEIYEIQRWGS